MYNGNCMEQLCIESIYNVFENILNWSQVCDRLGLPHISRKKEKTIYIHYQFTLYHYHLVPYFGHFPCLGIHWSEYIISCVPYIRWTMSNHHRQIVLIIMLMIIEAHCKHILDCYTFARSVASIVLPLNTTSTTTYTIPA